MSDYSEHLISMAGGDGEPVKRGMSEVIIRASRLDLQDSLALARELAAAGFGLVAEAKAAALEEAAREMRDERSTWCLDDAGRHWIKRTLGDLEDRAAELRKP